MSRKRTSQPPAVKGADYEEIEKGKFKYVKSKSEDGVETYRIAPKK